MKSVAGPKAARRAFFLGLAAFSIWSAGDAVSKYAMENGATPFLVLAATGLFNSLFMLLKAAWRRDLERLRPHAIRPVLTRACFGVVAAVGFYTGYAHLPLAEAYTIEFTGPFFLALGAAFFLKERLTLAKSACILSGFLGIAVAVTPKALFSGAGIGYLGAFCGTLFYAGQQLFNSALSTKEDPDALMIVGTLLCFATGMAFGFQDIAQITLEGWLGLLAASFTSQSGTYLMLAAFKEGDAHVIGSLQYTQFIVGSVLSFLIWGQIPTLRILAGAAIVIIAVFALARADRAEKQKQEALRILGPTA